MPKVVPTQSAEVLTRGHKKKERTRRKLIESAMELLATRDVGELTLHGLAEAAEMSNGTVYNYFDSRESVLDAVAIELATRFSSTIELLNASTQSGAERVSTGLRLYVERARKDPAWAKALLRVVNFHEGLSSAFAAFVRADINHGIKSGEFTVADASVALDLIISAGLGAIRAVLEGRAPKDYSEEMAFMLLRALGVSSAKAIKIASRALPALPVESDKVVVPVRKRGRPRKDASSISL
ncbi:MAG TPA: TetR/AcrR family transcriptional regulator [Limnobacter sp.]|nr:TetR/AcrR family transcriptional regulator [Limnobacter sp.]